MKPTKKSLCHFFPFSRKEAKMVEPRESASIHFPPLPSTSFQSKRDSSPLPPPFPLHFQPKILEGIMIEKVQEVLRCIPEADMRIKTFMRKNKNNCFTKSYRGRKKETG
jgi:hypothetical protein